MDTQSMPPTQIAKHNGRTTTTKFMFGTLKASKDGLNCRCNGYQTLKHVRHSVRNKIEQSLLQISE